MTKKYQELAFTEAVRQAQALNGSAHAYSKEQVGTPAPDAFGDDEKDFIESRDSFYLASINSAGWPYVQHRGGPAGFLKVLNSTTLGMADFRGNRQYVSLGNFAENDRVSLLLMDYPRKARLKILAHVSVVDVSDEPELLHQLTNSAYGATVERAFKFKLDAFDWNCPQHITPRYTEADVRATLGKMGNRIAELEAELAALKAKS